MKVLNAIATAAILIGSVLLFGAAGADDCGTYTMPQVYSQIGAAAALLVSGLVTKAVISNNN